MAVAVETEVRGKKVSRPKTSTAVRHERFSEAGFWEDQCEYFQRMGPEAWRLGEVPHYITSTAGMAEVYAECIVEYWRASIAAGAIDLSKPLYVFELGAGCGRLTYLLLKSLQRESSAIRDLKFCYLASDLVEANVDFIAKHPYLRPQIESGCLDTVLWDAERGGELVLRGQGLRFDRTDNPLVVVANYVFDGLRQDLFGFHYGQMLEGRVAQLEDHESGDTRLDYEWRPIDKATWLRDSWQKQLERYRERLDSSSVLFPTGALRCMEHIEALTRGRYFLLSADKGICAEQELRFRPAADFAFHGSFSLPVNYHAFSACLADQGAEVWLGRHREDGLIYHVAHRSPCGEQRRIFDDVFARVVARLDAVNPDDHFTLKKAIETVADKLAPEQLLAMLRLSRYDSRVLGLMIEPMLKLSSGLTEQSLRCWRSALDRCLENYFPLGEQDSFSFDFSLLAIELGEWRLAKSGLRLEIAAYGENVEALYYLAHCEILTGRSLNAFTLIDRALTLESDNDSCRELREVLRRKLDHWDALPWHGGIRDAELTLEPLGIEHAPAFFYQYRDPQIGVMARLPELETMQALSDWIENQYNELGRMTYAVMHADHGFVGVVSLQCREDDAYFYFWIGTDYQGCGFGKRAAAMLFEQAERLGVRNLFTSVYSDNSRSLNALNALGLRRLDASAEAPDDDLLFLHLLLGTSSAESTHTSAEYVDRFQRLCVAIDSPLKVYATCSGKCAVRRQRLDRSYAAEVEV